MSDWVEYGGVPPMDGTYETRMDEDDDETSVIYVRDGKAYKEDGTQRLFMNFEWRKIST